MPRPAPLPFLALGDSYTIGEGVPPEARWTHQMAARLRAEGLPLAAPHTVAQTGWTTDELAAALDAADADGLGAHAPFALVTLLVGVNDQYRGRDVAAFEAGFVPLVRRAAAYAGGHARRVLVLGIPDWGCTPFAEGRDRAAVARALDAYNAAAARLARAAGAAFVDVLPLSRTQGALVVADGLHPTAEAYAAWAEAALPAARRALGAQHGDAQTA